MPSTFRLGAAACALLAGRVTAVPTAHGDANHPAKNTAYHVAESSSTSCGLLTNNYNTEYTVEMDIGTPAQTLRVVPDSGSMDLLVDSTMCVDCGGDHNKYDETKSSTCVASGAMTELAYGQGEVLCMESKDSVTVAGVSGKNVNLLEMAIAAIEGFDESPYDGVMGMGPVEGGSTGTDDMLTSMGLKSFSICFGTADGSHGKLALGAQISGGDPYVSLEAKGTMYWALYMTALKMDDSDLTASECSPQCAAVIDSGTSLIGVPTKMYYKIVAQVGHVNPDCSNQDSLPDITITMGGVDFTLSSQHYVVKSVTDAYAANASSGIASRNGEVDEPDGKASGRTKGHTAGHTQGHTAHDKSGSLSSKGCGFNCSTGKNFNFRAKEKFGFSHLAEPETCQIAFFAMDEVTTAGPMVLFGIPFLRAYAMHATRKSGSTAATIGLSKVTSTSMCTSCSDEKGEADAAHTLQPGKAPHSATVHRKAPTTIRYDRLRFPYWAVNRQNSTRHNAEGKLIL